MRLTTSLCSSVGGSYIGLLWGPHTVRTLYDHWSWLYVIYVFLAWEVRRLVWILWWKAPVLSFNVNALVYLLINFSVQCQSHGISNATW